MNPLFPLGMVVIGGGMGIGIAGLLYHLPFGSPGAGWAVGLITCGPVLIVTGSAGER